MDEADDCAHHHSYQEEPVVLLGKRTRIGRKTGRRFPTVTVLAALAGLTVAVWGTTLFLRSPENLPRWAILVTSAGAGVFTNRAGRLLMRRMRPGWRRKLNIAANWAVTLFVAFYFANYLATFGGHRVRVAARSTMGSVIGQIEASRKEQGRYPDSPLSFLPVPAQYHRFEYIVMPDGYALAMEVGRDGSQNDTYWYLSSDPFIRETRTALIGTGDPDSVPLIVAREKALSRILCSREDRWVCEKVSDE